MAEGYLRHFAGDISLIKSAGVETHGVNPKAIDIMKEDGIDISAHTSNNVDEYLSIDFDYIITVCDHARERCPVIPGSAIRFHYNFPDPAKATGTVDEIRQQFRTTRDLIRDYCASFASAYLK